MTQKRHVCVLVVWDGNRTILFVYFYIKFKQNNRLKTCSVLLLPQFQLGLIQTEIHFGKFAITVVLGRDLRWLGGVVNHFLGGTELGTEMHVGHTFRSSYQDIEDDAYCQEHRRYDK